MREVYTTIVRTLQEVSTSLKEEKKLLMNIIGERDYSAQGTCHLLLQLPMFKASRDFIVLSLDGSYALEDHLEDHQRYWRSLRTPACYCTFNCWSLHTSTYYTTFRTRPYCSPDPLDPKYEQYFRQSLMQHKCFRHMSDLLGDKDSYAEAYTAFL